MTHETKVFVKYPVSKARYVIQPAYRFSADTERQL